MPCSYAAFYQAAAPKALCIFLSSNTRNRLLAATKVLALFNLI